MQHLYKADRPFVQTEFPGIRTAVIWSEGKKGAEFHEFKAGVHFPIHGHEGPEEIIVMSGRIRFDNLVLSAGDYLRVAGGEFHDAEALEDSVFFLSHEGSHFFKK
jgi:quercetin dioxygenase-like cupin family protein